MITLRDCYSLSDAVPDEVMAIAHHDHLPPVLAAGRIQTLLFKPWGAPALRQMILDEYHRAAASGDREAAETMAALYRQARRLHPGGRDRRRSRSMPPRVKRGRAE